MNEQIAVPVYTLTVHPLSSVISVLGELHFDGDLGQVILSAGLDEMVPVLRQRLKISLNLDAPYLLAGDLGGLGLSEALLMVPTT